MAQLTIQSTDVLNDGRTKINANFSELYGRAISAGTTLASSGTIIFSNSNGVSFGLNGNTLTASAVGGGNTGSISAGTTKGTLGEVVFSNSNGISFGMNGQTMTAQHNGLTSQSNQNVTAANGGFAFQTLSFSDVNGISFGTSAGSAITASHNALTSQSNQAFSAAGGSSAFQTLSFSNANGISFSNNAGQVQASYTVPTVTNSSFSVQDSATTINPVSRIAFSTGNNITATLSTAANHATVGFSHNLAGTSTGFAGANISGSITHNSSGINLSLSVAAPGGGGAVNFSAGTTSNDLQSVVFADANNISFGLGTGASSRSITASFNPINIGMSTNGNTAGTTGTFDGANLQYIFAGVSGITLSQSSNASSVTLSVVGNGFTLSTYEPYPAMGLSTAAVGVPTATSAGVSLYPFVVDEYVSAGVMNLAYSMSFTTVGTSSGRQTLGLAYGLYTRDVSTLRSLVSTSFSIGVTGNNSSYSINQPGTTSYTGYSTLDTNSAGSNITSGYTGFKLIGVPINTLLTPGNYWLGIIGTNSTSSVNVGISMSHIGAAMATNLSALAPIGSFSTSYSTGFDPRGGRWNIFQGSWTSAGSVTMIPASMAHNSITAAGLTYPLIKFWRT